MARTSTPAAAPAPVAGACGCGEATRRPTALWVAGHDARAAGDAARAAAAGDLTRIGALPTPALRAKAEAHAARLTQAAKVKAIRAQAAADLKAALATA